MRPADRDDLTAAAQRPVGRSREVFTVEIQRNGNGVPVATRVTHVGTGAAGTWPGWDPTQLVSFLDGYVDPPPVPAST